MNSQQQSKHDYGGYSNGCNASMNGSSSSALSSCARVPPLSHPPVQMVEQSLHHTSFYEDPYHYKLHDQNYQIQNNFPNHVQFASSAAKDNCDEEITSEKSSDNDQGTAISFN
jgi:hypothetical protein